MFYTTTKNYVIVTSLWRHYYIITHWVEFFLSCCVPNLQFYAFIINKNIFDFKIDSNSRIVKCLSTNIVDCVQWWWMERRKWIFLIIHPSSHAHPHRPRTAVGPIKWIDWTGLEASHTCECCHSSTKRDHLPQCKHPFGQFLCRIVRQCPIIVFRESEEYWCPCFQQDGEFSKNKCIGRT